jgi:small subunit ribosomal protein S11
MAEDKKKEAAASAPQQAGRTKPGKPHGKKKPRKSVAFGHIHISCTFNNTIVTVTDDKGETIAWSSSGHCGFAGTKKGTPFAAQITAAKAIQRAVESGMRQALVFVSGPGPGRETAIRAVQNAGLVVLGIKDVTGIPHNGCRPPKARRM